MVNELYVRSKFLEESSEFIGSNWSAKSKWMIGYCSFEDCDFKGIFWHGGNKDQHFCFEHNPRILQ